MLTPSPPLLRVSASSTLLSNIYLIVSGMHINNKALWQKVDLILRAYNYDSGTENKRF